MHGNHRQITGGIPPPDSSDQLPAIKAHTIYTPEPTTLPRSLITRSMIIERMDWTTWWLWRGARTRSLPELGRENPQRPWYCVSRHGRVGRRQVFQSIQPTPAHQREPPAQRRITKLKPITNAGWSSPVARQAHNLKVTGSNPVPATNDPIIPTEPPFSLWGAAFFAFEGRPTGAPGPPSAR